MTIPVDLKCSCGWLPKPFAIIPADSIQHGPYYCPDCNKILLKKEQIEKFDDDPS